MSEMDIEAQREAYASETTIHSDPFGLFSRDNRNHRKKYELIRERMAAKPGDQVLEVGCGHGLHAREYDADYRYTGVDLSPSLVEETNARLENGRAFEMDALGLAYADGVFDSVVGTAVLHHLPDARAALREWVRVTRPGGSVTLMEPNYLFPKDLITAHVVQEEQHKTQMAPWRLRRDLDVVAESWTLEHHIFTPPWPEALTPLYDRIDSACASLPGVRALSQMLLIHIET
jgi:SAM-dependent methyltransferase